MTNTIPLLRGGTRRLTNRRLRRVGQRLCLLLNRVSYIANFFMVQHANASGRPHHSAGLCFPLEAIPRLYIFFYHSLIRLLNKAYGKSADSGTPYAGIDIMLGNCYSLLF